MTKDEFAGLMREMFTAAYRGNDGQPWANMGFVMNLETAKGGSVRINQNRTDVEIKGMIADIVEKDGCDGYAVGLELVQIGSRAESEAIDRGADTLGSLSNAGSGIPDPSMIGQGADHVFAIFIGTADGLREVITFAVDVRKGKRYLGREQNAEGVDSEILDVFPKLAFKPH